MTEVPTAVPSDEEARPAEVGPPATVRLRRWKRLPLSLRRLLVLHALLLLVFTVLFPNYRSADEPFHMDLIIAAHTGDAIPWPAPGGRLLSRGVYAGGFVTTGRIPDRATLSASKAPARGSRPSYRQAGGATPFASSPGPPARLVPNQLVQHPPLYYYLMAPVLTVVPHWRDQPFDRIVALYRFLNALLILPLPLLMFLLARKVGLTTAVSVAAASVLLAVPGLYHIGSSVNNDNLLIPLLAGTTLLTASVTLGDVRLRTGALLGLLAGLALLTKGLALYLPLTMGLGYLVAAFRTSLRRALPAAALAMGVAFCLGGWWWVRNRLLYGTFQPDGRSLAQPHLVRHTTFASTGSRWLGEFARLVNQRFWSEPGSVNLPHVLSVATTLASALVLVGVTLSLATRRPRLADSLLLALPLVCLIAILAKGSWTVWSQVIRPAGLQGRYLYAGVPGLAVLAVAGVGQLLGRRQRWLPLGVLGAAGLMQLLGIWLTFGVYWLPESGDVFGGLHNLLAWSAWPPPLVVPVMLGLVVAIAGTFSTLIRDVRRPVPQ